MKIVKFDNENFGSLTTITSHKTGVIMFIGKEVAKMWGHTNLRQAVNRLCNKDEFRVIKLSKFPEFKTQLLSNNLLQSSNAPSIMLLTESALYKLALASNLEQAKPFRDWVTSEVLPSVRKRGYYSIADQSQKILLHTDKNIQLQNSKDINSKNMIEGGIKSVIEYNRASCLLHSGKSTKQIKELGTKAGLKSKERSSAKEVLRHIAPPIAGGMSFTDDLTKNGFDLKTASDLSKQFVIPLFQNMIELGIKPGELQ
jgi:prophage antirepressor-like protein